MDNPPSLSTRLRRLIAENDASISAHFSQLDIGLKRLRKYGESYPRLGPEMRGPLIPDECAAVSGRSWVNRGESTTETSGHLSGT